MKKPMCTFSYGGHSPPYNVHVGFPSMVPQHSAKQGSKQKKWPLTGNMFRRDFERFALFFSPKILLKFGE